MTRRVLATWVSSTSWALVMCPWSKAAVKRRSDNTDIWVFTGPGYVGKVSCTWNKAMRLAIRTVVRSIWPAKWR